MVQVDKGIKGIYHNLETGFVLTWVWDNPLNGSEGKIVIEKEWINKYGEMSRTHVLGMQFKATDSQSKEYVGYKKVKETALIFGFEIV